MKKLYIIFFLIINISCDDFLEPQSQTDYVPRDLNALNELLIGAAYIDPNSGSTPVFSLHEILSDDWSVTIENGNNTNNLTRYEKMKPIYAWHPNMHFLSNSLGSYQNVWKSTYQYILGCNAVLDYADNLEGAIHERKYVKAQALALRAFYYFQLVNLFGQPYNYNKESLGVPLKINSGLDLEYPKRATVEQVYHQIEEDLTNAESYFLNLSADKQFTKDGRVTLPMIQLTRARVALFKEEYVNVVTYCNKVISDWNLTLLNLNAVNQTTIQPYYAFTKYDNPEAIWLFGSTSDMARYSSEYIYTAPSIFTATTRRMFTSSPELLNSYAVEDLRKQHYILRESLTVSHLISSGKIPVNTALSPVSTDFARSLRLSEAYLMLAEAYYYTNQESKSVETLEKLRQSRFLHNASNNYKVSSGSTTGLALLKFIREERRREMCFEGLRWFDQRRYGMESFTRAWKEEGIVSEFVMQKNDPAFTLPIPFDAIERNPNLEQNTLSDAKY